MERCIVGCKLEDSLLNFPSPRSSPSVSHPHYTVTPLPQYALTSLGNKTPNTLLKLRLIFCAFPIPIYFSIHSVLMCSDLNRIPSCHKSPTILIPRGIISGSSECLLPQAPSEGYYFRSTVNLNAAFLSRSYPMHCSHTRPMLLSVIPIPVQLQVFLQSDSLVVCP
jgi:hypothetical protein